MSSLLTPPHSDLSSDDIDLAESRFAPPATRVSVSTTFHPDNALQPTPCDLVIFSADSVFFYAHSALLLSASGNRFGGLLPAPPPTSGSLPGIAVGELSPVLNIVLLTAYGHSCAHYAPSFDLLIDAVHALMLYGLSLDIYIAPDTPLHSLLLSHAPTAALGLYTLAASCNLHSLAKSASGYLLGPSLETLTDAQVVAIPSLYIKHLFCLHLMRLRALTRIIFTPPELHLPTRECNQAQLQSVARAWSLVSAAIIYEARPDMPHSTIRTSFEPLVKRIGCPACREAVTDRIKSIVGEWAKVQNTI